MKIKPEEIKTFNKKLWFTFHTIKYLSKVSVDINFRMFTKFITYSVKMKLHVEVEQPGRNPCCSFIIILFTDLWTELYTKDSTILTMWPITEIGLSFVTSSDLNIGVIELTFHVLGTPSIKDFQKTPQRG